MFEQKVYLTKNEFRTEDFSVAYEIVADVSCTSTGRRRFSGRLFQKQIKENVRMNVAHRIHWVASCYHGRYTVVRQAHTLRETISVTLTYIKSAMF